MLSRHYFDSKLEKMTNVLFLAALLSLPFGKVIYEQATKFDTSSYTNLDGEVLLYFNDKQSIYLHTGIPEEGGIVEKGNLIQIVMGDKEGFPVYHDREKQLMAHKIGIWAKDNGVIKDAIPRIDWKIQPDETRQIGKYTCRKAVGVFGGRVYDAWFTPEIPVPHGPYKLGGLPGLILEAYSRDGKVSFHFKSFEWVELEKNPIIPPTDALTFDSYQDFRNQYRAYHERKIKLARSMGGVTIIPAKTPDTHIEIGFWGI